MFFGFPAELLQYWRNRRQQIAYLYSVMQVVDSKCSNSELSLVSD